jgi:hypothetical protein
MRFEADRYSWREQQRRRRAWWRPYYDFIMRWPPVTRPIIVLFWVTLLYGAFVLGFLVVGGLLVGVGP